MTQSLISVVLFLVLLACLPFAIKKFRLRTFLGASGELTSSRIVSVVAVGPHQSVVTVEVGPAGCRTWLALGVTPQSITCLHTWPAQDIAGGGSAGSLSSGILRS